MVQDCEDTGKPMQAHSHQGLFAGCTAAGCTGAREELFVLPPLQLGKPRDDPGGTTAPHFTSAQDYGFGDPSPPLVYPHGSAITTTATTATTIGTTGMDTPTRTYTCGAGEDAFLFVWSSSGQVVVGTTSQDDPMMTDGPSLSRRSSFRQEGSSRRNSISLEQGQLVEITLPPSKKGEGHRRVLRRTSLSFKETAKVAIIRPAKSLSCKADLWFQESEMKLFRKQVNALVQLTDNGLDSESGKKYCMRGLERLMQPHAALRQRGAAWDAVLNEQSLQKKLGLFNEEDMANLYKFSTMISRHEAVKRAQEDAKEAAKYLESARRRCRHMSM